MESYTEVVRVPSAKSAVDGGLVRAVVHVDRRRDRIRRHRIAGDEPVDDLPR